MTRKRPRASATTKHPPVVPDRKISETIIDFGAPLVAELDDEQSLDVVRAVFKLIITIWNAHVTAMPVWGKPEPLVQLKALLKNPAALPEMIDAYHTLTQRRLAHFADDPRAVGEWDVVVATTGRIHLRCQAHVPPALMP